MRGKLVRLVCAAALGATLFGGLAASAHAAPPVVVFKCQPIAQLNRAVCVLVFRPDGQFAAVEAYSPKLTDQSNVYGVGVICEEGQLILIYQTGKVSSFHQKKLVALPHC